MFRSFKIVNGIIVYQTMVLIMTQKRILVLILGLMLSGCGLKGKLELPQEEKTEPSVSYK